MLLPSWCAPRRADAIEVIGTAAAMALAGAGYGRIGAGLGVPAATVRGWLRQAPLPPPRRCARTRCTSSASPAGAADPPLQGPAASPLGDALNAVAACAQAAITRFGLSRADLWPLLGRFGLARHLAPARDGSSFPPARAPACPRPGLDAHHDHHGAIPGAHRVTVSTAAPP